MFIVSSFTTSCLPTRTHEAGDFEAAVARALVDVDHLFERAYGATDSSQIEGQEAEYDELKEKIKQADEPAVGDHVQFGPLPDGYNIKIDNVAVDELA